jgi:hypothetical protein
MSKQGHIKNKAKSHKKYSKLLIVEYCLYLIAAVLFCIYAPVSAKTVSEKELFVYSENGIYYYNPYGTTSRCTPKDGGSSDPGDYIEYDPGDVFVGGDDNASAIIGTLMNNGYTHEAACAIAGNIWWESRMNPRKLEGGGIAPENVRIYKNGDLTYPGIGFGLAQWTFGTRQIALQEYADSRGLLVTSIQAQVGYLLTELASAEYQCGPSVLNSMGVDDATDYFCRNFEKPDMSLAHMSERIAQANYYMGLTPTALPDVEVIIEDPGDTGDAPGGPSSSSSSSSSIINCFGGGSYGGDYGGAGNPVERDGYISFLQCDPAWGSLNYGPDGVEGSIGTSICESGCGPTSFASIAVNLGVSTDPVETADLAGKGGMHARGDDGGWIGSSWDITRLLAEHFGLTYERIPNSVDAINEALSNGKMIHICGRGGMPFSEGGHYVAIVGMDEHGDWIIADPGRGEAEAIAVYSPGEVMEGLRVASAVGR